MHVLKRFAVTIAGLALLLVGVAMMVLPGPGILLIVAGLAVLATEYVWARRFLIRAKQQAARVQEAAVSSPARTMSSALFALALVAVGIAMFFIDDIRWPVLDETLDAIWSGVTGGILTVTGVILLTTTYLTMRTAQGEQTTYTPDSHHRPGATRYDLTVE